MSRALRGSLAVRLGAGVAIGVIVSAALTAAAVHWTHSVILAALIATLITLPALVWVALRIARPWPRTLQAITGAIANLHDGEFSVSIASPRPEELRRLVEAYNSLGALLRRERFDIYQRELLLDTVLQTTPLALVLTNAAGRIVYGNIAARQLLHGGRKLEGRELEGRELAALLAERPAALREALEHDGDTLFTLEVAGESEVYHLSRRSFLLHAQPHELMLLKQLTRELSAQEVEIWKKVIRVIAHELNNSLAPISSLVHSGKLLCAGADSSDHARLETVFETIGERAAHLATFIDGYARFAKLPKPRPVAVTWPDFLERLAGTVPFRIEGRYRSGAPPSMSLSSSR